MYVISKSKSLSSLYFDDIGNLVIGFRTRSKFDEEQGEKSIVWDANVHVIGCADKMNMLQSNG